MPFESTALVLALALCFDAALGYPDVVYRTFGHPVTWIGWLIARLETRLNQSQWSDPQRRFAGVIAVCILITIPVLVAMAIESLCAGSAVGSLVLAIAASTLIASRSLYMHVHDVGTALASSGLEGGRRAVAKIVGRDPERLDEHGVARAAIESLAENASDGVVAPVIWFAVLGLPGVAAYKAINTADSMIGHRTQRYEDFGWASARLDDLVNLPASRLTGLLFAAAAAVLPGGAPKAAIAAMRRDASKHRSPNAGWPESAMAGALGLKLNGPRSYGGVSSTDAYMGNGSPDATALDIARALTLASIAWTLMFALVLAACVIAHS